MSKVIEKVLAVGGMGGMSKRRDGHGQEFETIFRGHLNTVRILQIANRR